LLSFRAWRHPWDQAMEAMACGVPVVLGRNTGIPLEQALDFVRNEKPAPYVERSLTFGVGERVDLDGVTARLAVRRAERAA